MRLASSNLLKRKVTIERESKKERVMVLIIKITVSGLRASGFRLEKCESETLRVVAIIVSFLDCEVPLKDEQLTDIIKESCLLPLLESFLRSGSLLDISK